MLWGHKVMMMVAEPALSAGVINTVAAFVVTGIREWR